MNGTNSYVYNYAQTANSAEFMIIMYNCMSATHNNYYNYIIISSSNSFRVCYTAQAYTTSWVSYFAAKYYYTQTYSYTCYSGWLDWDTCYGSHYRLRMTVIYSVNLYNDLYIYYTKSTYITHCDYCNLLTTPYLSEKNNIISLIKSYAK